MGSWPAGPGPDWDGRQIGGRASCGDGLLTGLPCPLLGWGGAGVGPAWGRGCGPIGAVGAH